VTANTNPLSYNAWVQQLGILVPNNTQEVLGVYQFTDANLQGVVQSILNYSELRIQRDLDLLPASTGNNYTAVAGNGIFSIPVDDFVVVETLEVQTNNWAPLVPVSKEFIQNVYSGVYGIPQYFAPFGDNFTNSGDTNNNFLLGPAPNFAYSMRAHGMRRLPSLYQYASAGIADTNYSYISAYYPDLLLMASMIFISAYQRNFSATSDAPDMGQTYEKQYQTLRMAARAEEDRKKQASSGWSSYSTAPTATPVR